MFIISGFGDSSVHSIFRTRTLGALLAGTVHCEKSLGGKLAAKSGIFPVMGCVLLEWVSSPRPIEREHFRSEGTGKDSTVTHQSSMYAL